jgi:hypothetical protein
VVDVLFCDVYSEISKKLNLDVKDKIHVLVVALLFNLLTMVRKKIDNRIRVLIENGVTLGHRTMFVVVGDKGRDQVSWGVVRLMGISVLLLW